MSKRPQSVGHPLPKLKDGDLLHGKPPSLWGIMPSQTPIDDAREILRAKGVLDACKEYSHPQTGATGISCWPYFNMNHENGVVKFIEFKPSTDIAIAQVIEARGNPEGALSVYTDFPDGNIYTLMLLYYDTIWTTISLAEQVPRLYKVTPKTTVARITYSKPYKAVTTSPNRVPWRGYGEYPSTSAVSD